MEFPSNYKASPIELKRKFPSVDKPLKKDISPGAYFRNFRVAYISWRHLFPREMTSEEREKRIPFQWRVAIQF